MPPGDLYVLVHVRLAPDLRPQGRQPDPDRAGHVPRGGARRRDRDADAVGAAGPSRSRPGTPNGRTFRVRGKGVPKRDGSTGDLLVTVEVQVPKALSDAGPAGVGLLRRGRGRVRPALQAVRRRAEDRPCRRASCPHRIDRDAPVFVDIGGRPAGRNAPADAARLRPDGTGRRPAGPPGEAGATPPSDIARLRQIQRLSQDEGINLEGIRRILRMQDEIDELRGHARRGVGAAGRRPRRPAGLPLLHRRSGGQCASGGRPTACAPGADRPTQLVSRKGPRQK